MKQYRFDPVDTVVVTIDGPAGAGKSTAARTVAERLKFDFLDTGAMYRCATLATLRSGVDLQDEQAVAALVRGLDIEFRGTEVWLNGEDVSQAIRQPEVSSSIGQVADNRLVRQHLSALQRAWAENRRVVTDGRDQGTVVFPDACCKIFLTASSEERARRRAEELAQRGVPANFEQILQQQEQRDSEDTQRAFGGLRMADDAVELVTDGLTLEQVVLRLESIIQQSLGNCQPCASRARQSTSHE